MLQIFYVAAAQEVEPAVSEDENAAWIGTTNDQELYAGYGLAALDNQAIAIIARAGRRCGSGRIGLDHHTRRDASGAQS